MNNATDMLQRISESFGTSASVKSVFGEPIHANGRTVVPVAKVAYGFGGGAGGARAGASAERQGEGGGGGGGVRAVPAGALEITDNGTRFIPFIDLRWMSVAFAAGLMFGKLLAPRRRG
jgi:uncharacterized spore protein YtfJ